MSPVSCFVLLAVLRAASAQQAGTLKQEGNPTISVKECTKAGGCSTRDKKLVLDANWRWIHTTQGYTNCYTGNQWDTSICTDGDTCASNCALEGVDAQQYQNTYGITSIPGGVRLGFVTGANVGSRLFLLEDDDTYMMFKLKNREFALDVDSSQVQCGMNGATGMIQLLFLMNLEANLAKVLVGTLLYSSYGKYCHSLWVQASDL